MRVGNEARCLNHSIVDEDTQVSLFAKSRGPGSSADLVLADGVDVEQQFPRGHIDIG